MGYRKPVQTSSPVEQAGEGGGQEFIEGVRIRLAPAPVGRRLASAAIDMGIISAALYVVLIPFIFLVLGGVAADSAFGAFSEGKIPVVTMLFVVAYLIFCIVVFHGYYIHFETKTGMTPGKKMLGLKVVSVDGANLTRGQAVYRDVVRWYLDALLFVPGLISMLVTEKRQRIGDLLAGTMVVYSRAREETQNFVYVSQADYKALFAHLEPAIAPKEIRDDYLAFAYQAYVLGNFADMRVEAEQWLARAKTHLSRADELGLNENTVLRFFAELCFQCEREADAKRNQ